MRTFIYAMDIEESVAALGSSAVTGLSADEAARRLASDGKNELKTAREKPLRGKAAEQFKDVILLLLIAAAVLSAIFNDGLFGAIIIAVIIILRVVVAVYRSNRSARVRRELDDAAGLKARVLRSGQMMSIDVCDVVRGDIVYLRKGDRVPADIRLIESHELLIDEATITGETGLARKDAKKVLDSGTFIGSRCNLGFMGSYVACGRGAGVVYTTGMSTETGKNAMITTRAEKIGTPLEVKLASAVKTFGILFLSLCGLGLTIGILYDIFGVGEPRGIFELILLTLALAVAAVPRGITAAAAGIIASGVYNMVEANVKVKNFRTALDIGNTTVICTDKTGILTQNAMMVTRVADCENVYEVTGVGYKAKGHVVAEVMITRNIALMSEIVVLCNDASYDRESARITGDPTEGAMLVFGVKLGHEKGALETIRPRIHEIPFDPARRMMSTYNLDGERVIMYTKGAAEEIIRKSSYAYLDGEIVFISDTNRVKLMAQCNDFAAQGLRVLACAYKVYNSRSDIDDDESELIYVGMMGLTDPLREEVAASVKQCRSAGIGVKMITGDHMNTASAIAQALGISNSKSNVLTGRAMDGLTDGQLSEKIRTVNVFARVSPQHKLRIVTALQTMPYDSGRGGVYEDCLNTVAVIGSNTDDLPALRKADIAVAMESSGKDAARDVADVIITDDSFGSIFRAVVYGRTMYTNIRKTTNYILAFSICLMLLVFTVTVFSLPMPLTAPQLLLAGFLINTLPVAAIGMEKTELRTIARRPRNPEEAVLNGRVLGSSIARAVILYLAAFAAFMYGYFIAVAPGDAGQHVLAMSMCFLTLTVGTLLAAYSVKTNAYMGTSNTALRNVFLNFCVFLVLFIVMSVIYVPGLSGIFTITPLTIDQFAICAVLILLEFLSIELSKISTGR